MQAQAVKKTQTKTTGRKTVAKVAAKTVATKDDKLAAADYYPPLGDEGEFRWIDKNLLLIDDRAQRTLIREDIVKEIKNNLRWDCFQVMTVLERKSGKLLVAEGQHRKLGVTDRDDITVVPCLVFKSKGLKHEAEVFNAINSKKTRSSPRPFDTLKVDVVREDPIALQVNEVMQWMGAVIVRQGKTTNDEGKRSFSAVTRLSALLKQGNVDLKLLKGVCEQLKQITEPTAYISDELWNGLYVMAVQTNGRSLSAYWTKRFSEIGAETLRLAAIREVGNMGRSRGSGGIWAFGMGKRADQNVQKMKKLNVALLAA